APACAPARASPRCTACLALPGRGRARRRPTRRCRRCAAPGRRACRAATESASRRLAPWVEPRSAVPAQEFEQRAVHHVGVADVRRVTGPGDPNELLAVGELLLQL